MPNEPVVSLSTLSWLRFSHTSIRMIRLRGYASTVQCIPRRPCSQVLRDGLNVRSSFIFIALAPSVFNKRNPKLDIKMERGALRGPWPVLPMKTVLQRPAAAWLWKACGCNGLWSLVVESL